MRVTRDLTTALGLVVLTSIGPVAHAVDVPVAAVKLVIVDKRVSAGVAKAVFTVKDPAVTKGVGTDPADIAAVLQVSYDGFRGQFAMPPGGGWLANSASVAKYVNQDAPTGGTVKVGVIKPASVLKVVAKDVGDDPIDISQAPSGAVSVAHVVTNGSETIRHCTTFTGCAHKSIGGGTGWKLVCKAGIPDTACLGVLPPVCGDGVLAGTETCDPPGSSCGASLLCDGACRCHLCGNGVLEDGEQCDVGDTVPGDGCDATCQFEETVSGTGTVTTDGEADGATAGDPLEATVTSPVGGTITILETSAAGEPPAGLQLLGRHLSITAPIASPSAPLVLEFLLDQTLVGDLSPGAIIVFRNGVAVPDCTGSPGQATPDPCVASRLTLPSNDVQIIARSSQASPWGFGANVVFTLTSTSPVGTCGALRAGGAAGTVVKSLTCGGLSVGGGQSTFLEAGFRSGAQTQLNGTCDDTACLVSGRSAAETGSNQTCSQTGCGFGALLPVANGGVSVCLAHTFMAPAAGTIDHTAGSFTGSLPLASAVYLTANAISPCPRCLGGVLGVPNSGSCDPIWHPGNTPGYPDAGAPCTPLDVAGSTQDCEPPAASLLPPLPLAITPVTTGTATLSGAGGVFCPFQANAGAFGCAGGGAANAVCPGGNLPPVPDYVETIGAPAGAITPGPHPIRLASTFCVPSVGGTLGFLINGAANLPGPAAVTLPETIDVVTAISTTSTTVITTTSTSMTSTTITPPTGSRLLLTTSAPAGSCGSVRAGGASGTLVKTLACGGINFGGGLSTFTQGPMPGGALTEFNADCTGGPACAISALAAVDTGSNFTCSTAGCGFGAYVPVSNAGTSVCLRHTFSSPASGTLDNLAGTFVGSLPLSSTAYLTANATSPCPKCLGGTPGVVDSGACDPAWLSGSGGSPDASQACTPVDAAGDAYDCEPSLGGLLGAMPFNLTPATTGAAVLSGGSGFFCPGQANAGAFGCAGTGAANVTCPGGNAPPVVDYIELNGMAAGPLTPGGHAIRLASTFCVPTVGGTLGFLINSAANLPGPGAVSLPATAELVP